MRSLPIGITTRRSPITRKAIELNPRDPSGYNSRGIAYFNHKEVDRAIADYTQAMELDPKNVVFVANRANCYYRTGPQQDLDKALADDNLALRLDPKSADRYNDRARTYFDKHELDKAIADYSQAIQLDPSKAVYWSNRANAYYDQHELDKTIADYSQAIQLDPNKPIYFVHRAKVYEDQGGREKRNLAIADLKNALKLYETNFGNDHPDVANCTNLLAGQYFEAGNYAEAEPLLKRSLSTQEKSLGPDDPGLVDTIGWLGTIYHAQAKYAEALSFASGALRFWKKRNRWTIVRLPPR